MSGIFNILLTQPFSNLIVFLYSYVAFHDLGIAIIMFTVLMRLILWPIFYGGLKSQAVMQKIAPEIQKAQDQNKGNREAQAVAVMEVYKRNKVNPFSPFLYLLLQLPFIIVIYKIFPGDFSQSPLLAHLYSFIPAPGEIDTMFLGLIDLAKPNMIIVGLTAIAQYVQSKLAMRKPKPGETPSKAQAMNKYMVFLGPVLAIIIFIRFPAAIGLYWLTTSVVSILQQRIINKKIHNA